MMKKFLFRAIAVSSVATYACIPFAPEREYVQAISASWIEAKAECVMEVNSRRILYASNADTRLPMASTTKILTATTVLENCTNIEEEIEIPAEAAGVEGSSVYLKNVEIYSVKDLLYGLMLRSGNDCATALALHFGGNIANFATMMNITAQKAGALSSHFENPHGLPRENHYTTAQDLSYITCYAMQSNVFREIVSTEFYSPRSWKNKNKMLQLCEGGIGVKTGYTKEAGRCLVSAAERENMTLVCTVLSCPTTYERSIALLNDAFEHYKNVRLLASNEVLEVRSGKDKIACIANREFYYPLLEEERELIEICPKALGNGLKKKKSGEIVGQLEIYLSKRLLFSENLYKL